jgi:hypothetical protein
MPTAKVREGVIDLLDLDRLSSGEKLIAASGISLFILSFVPYWAGINYPPGTLPDETVAAWGGYPYFVKLGLLLALMDAIFVILKAGGLKLILPAAPGLVYVALAGADALFMLAYVIIGPPLGGQGLAQVIGLHASRGILLFVGSLLALTQTYGGWLHMRSTRATPIASAAT